MLEFKHGPPGGEQVPMVHQLLRLAASSRNAAGAALSIIGTTTRAAYGGPDERRRQARQSPLRPGVLGCFPNSYTLVRKDDAPRKSLELLKPSSCSGRHEQTACSERTSRSFKDTNTQSFVSSLRPTGRQSGFRPAVMQTYHGAGNKQTSAVTS